RAQEVATRHHSAHDGGPWLTSGSSPEDAAKPWPLIKHSLAWARPCRRPSVREKGSTRLASSRSIRPSSCPRTADAGRTGRRPSMPASSLPPRPNLEWLRKAAKKKLAQLRRTQPDAKLADAQLAVAREHGFPSWRKLKAHVDEVARAAER